MPIRPPSLDDRSFDDLVEEVLARIPAHTPEWTNPRLGDPGRTLIELFAWLTDTLLYRANLIPERQRLAFLRLLGEPLRPAIAARGLISVKLDEEDAVDAVTLQPFATVTGPAPFETRSELTVLPVTGQAYCKRPLTDVEKEELQSVLLGLLEIYQVDTAPRPYVTTPVFAGGILERAGFDVVQQTVDRRLWVALLAARPELVAAVRQTLGGAGEGRQRLLNVGVEPTIQVPALFEDIGPRARIPHVWELSTGREIDGEPEYLTLDAISDSTAGLTQSGIVRLALPGPDHIGAPSNNVRDELFAGVGDRPPRLDDPQQAARLVAWLRLRPTVVLEHLAVSWIGINAVEVDQRQTITSRVTGISTGAADQDVQLPGQSVERETLLVEVEEPGQGYQAWQRVEDVATAGRDDAVYSLDSEAGTIRFGDGIRGRIPEVGRRIRVATMRAGGGQAGNLPPGSLTGIRGRDITGAPVSRRLRVVQPLATTGGDDPETLEEAERRIPATLRDRNRAVTEEDYRRLAVDTPAVRVGRVEVLPRFKPHQRRPGVPGVVSVMVLPHQEAVRAPNPRPDRWFLETIHAYLSARRPIATELYTIGCEYKPLGLSVGITIRDGFGHEAVVHAVREALQRFLWPLVPGGPDGSGWPLERSVADRELEVTIARVAGVRTVRGVKMFERANGRWLELTEQEPNGSILLKLLRWQLPELLRMVVVTDMDPPTDLRGVPDPFARQAGAGRGPEAPGGAREEIDGGIAIPVVPEVC